MTDLAILVPEEGIQGIETASFAEVNQPRKSQFKTRRPKIVDPKLVQQAIDNNPLETMPRWKFTDEVKASSLFRQALPQLKTSFLEANFLLLADLGITFETSPQDVALKLQALSEQKPHLTKHSTELKTSFEAFSKIFSFLDFIIEKGRFEDKHLTSIHTICSAYASINDVVRGARLMKPIGLQVEFNRDRYIFELPTVFSTANLPEILFAMPVCFMNIPASEKEDDPKPSHKLKTVCDIVGSRSFTYFFQIYNRRDRSIQDFKGPDPIPTDYLEFRKLLQPLVDIEIIATPYHGIASKEWADPNWAAGIDPVALGLYEDIPYFTMFKRWSGNGIFPLLADLMADTADHIKKNASKMRAFSTPYWYRGERLHANSPITDDATIIKFAEGLSHAFENGNVFQFLRQ